MLFSNEGNEIKTMILMTNCHCFNSDIRSNLCSDDDSGGRFLNFSVEKVDEDKRKI